MKKEQNLRKHQLSFCSICSHKELNLKEGIICGLTKQRATFINECESYSENKNQISANIEKKTQNLITEIETKYLPKNCVTKNLRLPFIQTEIQSHSNIDLNKKRIYRNDHLLAKVITFICLTGLILFSIYNWKELISLNESKYYFILGFFLFFSILFFMSSFIEKNEPRISLEKKYLIYVNYTFFFKRTVKKIYWDEILVLRLLETQTEYHIIHEFVFGMSNKEIIKINIVNLDTNAYEFYSLIKKYTKNVA